MSCPSLCNCSYNNLEYLVKFVSMIVFCKNVTRPEPCHVAPDATLLFYFKKNIKFVYGISKTVTLLSQ